ncbi:MAG: T9SS type A sorting domain-containing protein [Candidatus Azobacteroides sp.]|nr:T9SS type A sorting domain-containing protein [Candidatus Azobacteroides sp.]
MTNTFYKFQNGNWYKINSENIAAKKYAAGFAINGMGYYVGGGAESTPSCSAFKYNPNIDTWTLDYNWLGETIQRTSSEHKSFVLDNIPYIYEQRYLMPYDVDKKTFLYEEEIIITAYNEDISGTVFFVLNDIPYLVTGHSNRNGYDNQLWYNPVNTSIGGIIEENKFNFPSKINNTLSFEWKKEKGNLIILNISGQIALQEPIVKGKQDINTSSLQKGLYLIILQTDKETFSFKIIKE